MQLLDRKVNASPVQESSLLIVLAESNIATGSILAEELKKDRHMVIGRSSVADVDEVLSLQTPDILLLGNIEGVSFLNLFRRYSEKYPDLPIILLKNDGNVDRMFRDWAVSKGVFDVFSSFPSSLNLLRDRLKQIVRGEIIPLPPVTFKSEDFPETPTLIQTRPVAGITYQQVPTALNQIAEYSKKYFGELVLTNYWKKAHSAIVSEHPWLQTWIVKYTGTISYFGEEIPDEQITDEQFQSLKLWTKGFLKECDRIIGGYTSILAKSDLSDLNKKLIS